MNRFRKEITIRHQVLRLDGKLVLAPPKNDSGRTVPMGARALTVIDTHVQQHATTVVRCSCCGKDWHVVFTQDGELIDARKFGRYVWNPALVSVGLAPGRHVGQHNLRHYWVSLLIDGGATPKDIQTYAGHRSIQTTFDKYGHLFERAHDRTRSIIDQAFPATVDTATPARVYPVRTAESQ